MDLKKRVTAMIRNFVAQKALLKQTEPNRGTSRKAGKAGGKSSCLVFTGSHQIA